MSFSLKKKAIVEKATENLSATEIADRLQDTRTATLGCLVGGVVSGGMFTMIMALPVAQGHLDTPALILWGESTAGAIGFTVGAARLIFSYIDLRARLTRLQIVDDLKTQGT